VASPLQGLLTEIVALGTSQLVGRTVELARPDGPIVARIERVALRPSDPAPAPVLDPLGWWLDTIDAATTGVARLLGFESTPADTAGRVELLESAHLTLRDVTSGARRIDRVDVHAVAVEAALGVRPEVRCGPIELEAMLTVDDVRSWLPPDATALRRSLGLRADGRVGVKWKRGPLQGEVAGRVECHADTVDVVIDRLMVAGREVTIPLRWRQRRSLSTAPLTAIGAEVRAVTVQEGAVTVALALEGWKESVSYEQLVRLQVRLADRAGRVAVDLVRGRQR
jgi:hypothetical protein